MTKYRKADINDTQALTKIRVDFLTQTGNITTDEEKARIKSAYAEFLSEVLTDGSFTQWLALEDGEIAATSSVSFYRLPPHKGQPNGKVAYIGNMFTYPEYRRRGFASKLLELAVDEAKNRGCKKILLNATDMGRPLYEKFGFTDTTGDMIFKA